MVNLKKRIIIFLVIFVIFLIIFLNPKFVKFWTGKAVEDYDLKLGEINGSVWKKTIYHPNGSDLAWNHMPLSYFFNESLNDNESYFCPDSQKERIQRAFETINNETNGLISFVETSGNEDIEIVCYSETPFVVDSFGAHLMKGEGVFRSKGNEIVSAVLNFYNVRSIENQNRNCLDLEFHEIFHLFGIRHVDNKKSLMYVEKIGTCKYKIDDWIIEDLIQTYEGRFEEILLAPEDLIVPENVVFKNEGKYFFSILKKILWVFDISR